MQDPQIEQVEQEEVEDLDAAIMAAMDEAESVADEAVAAATADSVEDEIEQPEAETAEAEEPEEQEEAAEAEESEVEEESPPIEARHHWKAADKELFAEMPRNVQQRWLEREDEFQSGMVKKGEELAQVRQFQESVQSAVSPYVQDWQIKGIDPYTGFQRALAIVGKLDKDPQSALVELAQERGVNLEQAIQDAPYVDPQVHELQRQVRELSEQQETVQQSQTQAQQQGIEQTLRDFEDARDADGNPKHPHFQRLFEPMGIYIKTGKAQGLEDAYELAMRYDPDIQNELAQQNKVSTIQSKKESAKRAKAASKTVDSPSTGVTKPTQTLDDAIMEQLEAQGVQ